jgi:hypothetical protein
MPGDKVAIGRISQAHQDCPASLIIALADALEESSLNAAHHSTGHQLGADLKASIDRAGESN